MIRLQYLHNTFLLIFLAPLPYPFTFWTPTKSRFVYFKFCIAFPTVHFYPSLFSPSYSLWIFLTSTQTTRTSFSHSCFVTILPTSTITTRTYFISCWIICCMFYFIHVFLSLFYMVLYTFIFKAMQ